MHIDTVVLSTQHTAETDLEKLKKELVDKVLTDILPTNLFDDKTKIFINPTGRFVVGGPAGDTGLTGRKIIVDTYGGYARHGGGAFPERILPRWIAALRIWQDTWQRILLHAGMQTVVKSS